jgi:hypothetical protein
MRFRVPRDSRYAVLFGQGQKLERQVRLRLFSPLPFAHKIRRDVEVACEYCSADLLTFSERLSGDRGFVLGPAGIRARTSAETG